DRYMTAQDLLDLGRAFDSFEPDDLGTFQLPVYNEIIQGKDVLHLVQPQADSILDEFRGTGQTGAAAEVDPANVNLRVLNGGAPDRGARGTPEPRVGRALRVHRPADAPAVERTEVRLARRDLASSRLVARHLAADVLLVSDSTVSEITIVLGPDLLGV